MNRSPPLPWLLLIAATAVVGCDCGGQLNPERSPWKQDAGPPSPCAPPWVGSGQVLAGGLDGPRKLAADDRYLYFTEAGGIGTGRLSRVPLDSDGGVAAEVMATGFNSPDAVAVDNDYVYFLDEDGVWRVNKDTFQPTQLAVGDVGFTNSLVGETTLRIHQDALLVGTGLEYLVRLQKDGTGPVDLFTSAAGTSITAAIIEDSQVYFLVSGSGGGEASAGLYRVPVDGSASAERLWAEPTLGRDLALTADSFVWTEGSADRDGAVRARSRVDGGVITYADQLWAPTAPVVMEPFVYFQARTDPSPSNPASELFFRMASRCDPLGAPVVGPSGFGPGDVLLREGVLYFTSLGVAGQGYVGRVP